ncbi:MAG: homocysteine S-methyltransferase family protein [Alphaproteobacteria bacterium]|jgi:S-methylmethionine-dependent homocysteine/selenocysteine methylase|nr:homocysteine S-methyltransferase family protein [Rhodospirillaceae bacterium]MBT6511854.1 homocysteine S-methyltransferase family protein [Rhodospirillaceae bacterium]MBT7613011.1 homocysteine S-methyltransferase family protein [Rhodospirillaceae bacterium]MBT7648534.1 homocysteine S-methyltransferase family protein [Rhodospirillaceae bacterium]MDG2482216.1 homocysteine S-methyltransferase family protein [Alphaproteobacteria bacterium]
MNRYEKLMQRIDAGERIVIDGATGTEVERRGVPKVEHAWNGGGTLSHPEIVREIHLDYIRHGAEIVISNTFATHRHCLRDAGVEDQFEEYNRRAVELAIEARSMMNKPDVLVAGGLSYWSFIERHPPLEDLLKDATEQAAIMAKAGVDLLMLEMMVDIDRMLVLLEAAQSTGLPVWVGFSMEPDDAGNMCLFSGQPLEDALAALEGKGVPLVNVMHTEVRDVDASLDVVAEHWNGLVGVYAHTGDTVDGDWVFDGIITPEDYAAAARRWLDRGINVVGGCCGIWPEHIEAVSKVA